MYDDRIARIGPLAGDSMYNKVHTQLADHSMAN